jgi:hypothetical protein
MGSHYNFPMDPKEKIVAPWPHLDGCFSIAFSVAAFDLAGKHSCFLRGSITQVDARKTFIGLM